MKTVSKQTKANRNVGNVHENWLKPLRKLKENEPELIVTLETLMETERKQAKANRDVETGAHCPPRAVISLGPHEYKTTSHIKKKEEREKRIHKKEEHRKKKRRNNRIFYFRISFLLHVQPAMESNKATRNHNVGNPLFNAKTYLLDASSFPCPCALSSGLPALWFPVFLFFIASGFIWCLEQRITNVMIPSVFVFHCEWLYLIPSRAFAHRHAKIIVAGNNS